MSNDLFVEEDKNSRQSGVLAAAAAILVTIITLGAMLYFGR